jgi:hypothetical protein
MGDESNGPPPASGEGTRPPDDPRYPPQSVLQPAARRSAVITYVGGLVVLAAIVGVAMMYWIGRDKGRVDPATPQAVGTVGTAPGGLGRTDGGFDPQKRPDTAREELELRGAGTLLTRIDDVFAGSPASVAGRQVEFREVEVESGGNRSFWVRDGSARIAVVTDGDTRVTPGSRVDVKGVAEPDGSGGVRVRAQRVSVR